ncbi:MAG TPA: glycosyltransferase [Methanosarcinales archaeon]|nr:glycosyltransferase [Methanosarcinales archaeon]
MEVNPIISVIVPVLNEEKYLEPTLQAIKNQNTNVPYELIVSDGGSCDSSLEIAEKYADKILSCSEKGIGIGRHTGAINARKSSKYFVFIDSDTIIPSYYLAWAHYIFNSKKALIAFSAAFEFSEKNPSVKFAERVANQYLLMRGLFHKATLPGFNTCVRKEGYFKAGGYRNVLLEDVDFSRRIQKLGKTRYFPEVTVINSARRLKGMGLIGTIYYYVHIDKLSKKLGIADGREYIGIR